MNRRLLFLPCKSSFGSAQHISLLVEVFHNLKVTCLNFIIVTGVLMGCNFRNKKFEPNLLCPSFNSFIKAQTGDFSAAELNRIGEVKRNKIQFICCTWFRKKEWDGKKFTTSKPFCCKLAWNNNQINLLMLQLRVAKHLHAAILQLWGNISLCTISRKIFSCQDWRGIRWTTGLSHWISDFLSSFPLYSIPKSS